MSGMWLGMPSRTDTKKTHVFKRNCSPCSEYDNHSKLDNEHRFSLGGGDLYDHLMSTKIFTLIMNEIFI